MLDKEEAALLMEWIDEIEAVTPEPAIAARIRLKLAAIVGVGVRNLTDLRRLAET